MNTDERRAVKLLQSWNIYNDERWKEFLKQHREGTPTELAIAYVEEREESLTEDGEHPIGE